jgi:mRNA interferase MazF
MFLISRGRAPPNRRSSTCSMSPQPGEVWLADLGLAAKTRPVVIVSRQDPNPPRALVLYVPLTTQRRFSPYEVPLQRFPFLDRDSVANVQGLGSIPTVRLERKLGRLSNEMLAKLKGALAFALDLDPHLLS